MNITIYLNAHTFSGIVVNSSQITFCQPKHIYKLSDLMNNETSSILCNLAKFCKIIIEYFNLET